MHVGHTGVGGALLREMPADGRMHGGVVQYSGAAPGLGHICAETRPTSVPELGHMHAAAFSMVNGALHVARCMLHVGRHL
jgi:hypothetical protein